MNNIQKLIYIKEYDILSELKDNIEIFKKQNKKLLIDINNEINKQFNSYSYDIYKQYKDDLLNKYNNNFSELIYFIQVNYKDDTINKMLWVKYLRGLSK
jgi:hypothetical protein